MSTRFLLENISADASTPIPLKLDGGGYRISVYAANFGGGAITFNISTNGPAGTFIPLAQGVGVGVPVSLNANSQIDLPASAQGEFMTATLSGSTGASGVNAVIAQ